LGIPHMRASVVLTTLRLGLPGVHIIALTWRDIVVLGDTEGADNGLDEDICCWAYAWMLLQIPKIKIPLTTENTAKIEIILLIVQCIVILLFMRVNYKLSNFL
jgi:hypothetical protein